ncbi:serine/threonine-protein kinase [Frigoriglobus tundricola]|uniref:Protein kinase domain-containing protein n=1 Tax=Frigoriglobus tundricola TaxID=2774151 RepID=A0A6M5YGW0_9BACT|nr:serine/threonine-protein kinase [Frigoriglobus tundricola]QJW93289.1 hypothetical protein FTUN_0795 [Frigoriglobus tundricola]
MTPVLLPDCGSPPPYAKSPGQSPLPGYVLLEPLGRGGFGEVWKCEAPGGLHKAIKFVAGDTDAVTNTSTSAQLRQELDAFQQVKAIRHPFLLSLERVELVGNELVMVMELADRQLGDRFTECRAQGLPGIPREELLGYLREAAEALDVIGAQYGLQHLDVKPANLFLTAGHVQVGDYGLVSKLDAGKNRGESRGLTPRYAAPEVLCGQVHTRSDQYSLALVYQELLTGTFPFNGTSARQLMMQHMSAQPDLSALAEPDRAAMATALAKQPEARFASCTEFVRALAGTPPAAPAPGSGGSGVTRAVPAPSGRGGAVGPPDGTGTPAYGSAHETLHNGALPFADSLPQHIRLEQILSVVPTAWLQGRPAAHPGRPPAQVVNAILRAAEARTGGPAALGAVSCGADGTWTCRFLTTIDPRVARVKLDLLWEEGGVAMDLRSEQRVVFRRLAPQPPSSGWFGSVGKKAKAPDSGLEVSVELPETSHGIGEVTVIGKYFGNPPPDFTKSGEKVIVKLIDGIRRTLNNVEDRRKHPRVPAPFPLELFPIHSDGHVEPPIPAVCRDVSAGGMAFVCKVDPPTKHLYVTFDGVAGTAGLGVLIQIITSEWQENEVLITSRYRLDLWPDRD